MKVSKWGNSLAIRLSAELVEKLGVKEGDEVEAQPGFREETVSIRRKRTRDELLEAVRKIRKELSLPPGYKFTRADAYEDDEY